MIAGVGGSVGIVRNLNRYSSSTDLKANFVGREVLPTAVIFAVQNLSSRVKEKHPTRHDPVFLVRTTTRCLNNDHDEW
jgi:hypothetical protein